MFRLNRKYQTLLIVVFLAVYFLIQFAGLFGFYSYGWDESVYIHMSKYIRSGGSEGLLENLRPIFFPIILTPFSDNIFISRLFILVLSIATLWIFYLIGRKHMNSELGWVFPIALALFPLYYLSSNSVLTEIPALFFHALSIYCFFERKYIFSGMLGFLAFFTRFPFGIYLPILFIGIFFLEKKKSILKNMSKFILGVLIGSPLFLVNTYLFYPEAKNVFMATIYPILNQFLLNQSKHHISVYVWYYYKGPLFYLKYLLNWTVLSVFTLVGILFLIIHYIKHSAKQKKSNKMLKNNALILVLMLLPLSYLLITPHREIRYLMLVIPWIIYFMCFGLIETIRFIKRKLSWKNKILASAVIFIILVLIFGNLSVNSFTIIKNFYYAPEELYNNYFFALEDLSPKNKILTSVPMIKTKAKIEIGYYNDRYFYRKLRQDNYDYVYYTADWFPCHEDDLQCLKLREDTKNYLENNYGLHINYSLHQSDFLIYSRT